MFAPPCLTLLFGPAGLGSTAQLFAGGGITLLLVLGVLTRTRLYFYPSLLALGKVGLSLAPESSAGWGGVGLIAAFGVLSLGTWLSLNRERVLGWLSESEEPPQAGTPLPAADASPGWMALGVAALALCGAVTFSVVG